MQSVCTLQWLDCATDFAHLNRLSVNASPENSETKERKLEEEWGRPEPCIWKLTISSNALSFLKSLLLVILALQVGHSAPHFWMLSLIQASQKRWRHSGITFGTLKVSRQMEHSKWLSTKELSTKRAACRCWFASFVRTDILRVEEILETVLLECLKDCERRNRCYLLSWICKNEIVHSTFSPRSFQRLETGNTLKRRGRSPSFSFSVLAPDNS